MDNKKIKSFRLSSAALEVLDKQQNASKFIEDLILGNNINNVEESSYTGSLDEQRMEEIVTNVVWGYTQKLINEIETLKSEIKKIKIDKSGDNKENKVILPDPELGFPCCQKNSPCKHWSWDSGEVMWKNIITGKTREA